MTPEDRSAREENEGRADETAGVIARPPFLYLGGLLLGLGIDWLLPLPPLPFLTGHVGLIVGIGLGIVGFGFVFAAAGRFIKAGTKVPTNRPTTALVTDGLYRVSRNPIYIGLTLIYLAFIAGFASLGALALLPAVLLVMEFGVIHREERYLERRFGQPYRDYRARVRRWF